MVRDVGLVNALVERLRHCVDHLVPTLNWQMRGLVSHSVSAVDQEALGWGRDEVAVVRLAVVDVHVGVLLLGVA